MFTETANEIFNRAIGDYHRWDDVDHPIENPYEPGSLEHLLYHKNWIDTVQWHLEDIIRDPQIDPVAALAIKRRIDKSNQDRTDMVEYIDSYLLDKYKDVEPRPDARLNTETPGVGYRPSVDPGAEDLPHGTGGRTYGRRRSPSRGVPQETRRVAGAAGRASRGRSKS